MNIVANLRLLKMIEIQKSRIFGGLERFSSLRGRHSWDRTRNKDLRPQGSSAFRFAKGYTETGRQSLWNLSHETFCQVNAQNSRSGHVKLKTG